MSDPTTSAPAIDSAALLRRGLFAYLNGVDPTPVIEDQFVIQGRLADACPGGDIAALDALLLELTGPPPAAAQADGSTPTPTPSTVSQIGMVRAGLKLAPIIRAGFALPPLDATGRGLSVMESLNLLTDFLDALGGDEAPDADANANADVNHSEADPAHADHPGGPASGI